MLYIIITVLLGVIGLFVALPISLVAIENGDDPYHLWFVLTIVLIVLSIGLTINGCINGFIYYPATEGTHIGVVTAIDLEGVYFRRWEVYLKSDGFSSDSDGKVSNETKYLLYENERELVEKLQQYQGKKVKLYYGFDGGKIRWNSCGTYHITNVELLEE